ncbi:MAG: methyltransferase domain-containing protein, partial [Acidimicrobiia bacterium]
FARVGLDVVGVDPSAVMLEAARARTAGVGAVVLRATGEALPFHDEVFSGCRIERVLIHVGDPAVVLAEALRCIEPGGLITVFEPDWSAFTVRSEIVPGRTTWLTSLKHPGIGARLWDLLESLGCDVLDRVEELSVWRSLQRLERVTGVPAAVDGAVAAGRIDRSDAERWIDEQRQRDAEGQFYALMPKIQVIATKR